VGGPIPGQPLSSSEVVGINKIDTPGIDFKADFGKDVEGNSKSADGPQISSCKDVAGGGDSAAGSTQECQIVSYDDGSSYTGLLVSGKRHGQGLWKSQTGQYEGQWKADIQHGRGRQTWSDGRVYEGQFENGKFSGTGRMVWHTQKGLLTYEGEYKDDLKQGKGKFVWADGRTYDGEWYRGMRHGRGMYMNGKCEQKIGIWANDKFERWEQAGVQVGDALKAPAP